MREIKKNKKITAADVKNLNLIKEILNNIQALQRSFLIELSGSKFTHPIQQTVFQEIFIRNYYILFSVNKLWEDFKTNGRIKFPIAILLRNGVSDFITLCHLAKYRSNEIQFKTEFDRLNQNFFISITKGLENKPMKEKNTQSDLLKKFFPLKFDNSGNFNEKIKTISTEAMSQQNEKGEFESFSDSYPLYKRLSQYEHYSDVTLTMMQRDLKNDLFDFMMSIELISIGIYLNLEWLGGRKEMIEQMEKFIKTIGQGYNE